MSRKFSIILVLCIALFGAILAGYWDMLSSERQKQDAETVAETASGSQPSSTPAPPAGEPKASAAPEVAAAPENAPAAAPPPPAATPPTAETQTAEAAKPPQAQATMSDAPRFDLLRVEPDGSAVIAGQAAADSEVRILSGDKQVGRAKASRDGDFALVLDERLTVGSHSIRIEAQGPDGSSKASREIAVVNVPKPENPGELLAMIEQPGQPSRIIAVPKPEASEPAEPVSGKGDAKTQAETPTNQQASVVPPASPAATATADAKTQPFAVEAVEIENGTIYIAGRAEGKEPVRVYVDDKLVGEDLNRANGRFLVTAQVPLTQGEHHIRADILGSDGKVASRVEVPFTKPESETMSALAADEPRADVAAPQLREENETAPIAPSTPTASAEPAPKDAPGVGTVIQPALQTVDTRVLIRRGDTLWRISRDTYGLGRRYTVIYLANGDQIRNPNRIYPGQLLRLPKHEDEQQTR